MFKIAETVPVRTRLPGAAWVLAGVVVLFSFASTIAHLPAGADGVARSLEQAIQQIKAHNKAEVRAKAKV
jgi:hypothetical protein